MLLFTHRKTAYDIPEGIKFSIHPEITVIELLFRHAERFEHDIRYLERGLTAKKAQTLADELAVLKPLAGAKQVTDAQRWRAAVTVGSSGKEKLQMLDVMFGDSDTGRGLYKKVSTAVNMGVSPNAWVTLQEKLPGYDADGNGSYTQAEVKAALEKLVGIGLKERAVLWQSVNKGWKATNNPFSVSAGEKYRKAMGWE